MTDVFSGIIVKALGGFYYVRTNIETVECRARGRFRIDKITPLVGDHVKFMEAGSGKGYLTEIAERRNSFVRPPVANIDVMVIIASGAKPVSDPFLIDRITAIAANNSCECLVCINKCDLDSADELFSIYRGSGFRTFRTSAVTREGINELSAAISGKICAFTGNSGVGKSSILNALEPEFSVGTAEISKKLGRGKHTTRHVELFELRNGAFVADTPGFAAFELAKMDFISKDNLQFAFSDFAPYIGKCRFADCAHIKESGCAVLEAMESGNIVKSRHASYVRLYEQAKLINDWDSKKE